MPAIKHKVYICKSCLSTALRTAKFQGFTVHCDYHNREEYNARYAVFTGKIHFRAVVYRVCTKGISSLLSGRHKRTRKRRTIFQPITY